MSHHHNETGWVWVCDLCGEERVVPEPRIPDGWGWMEGRIPLYEKVPTNLCPGCCLSFKEWLNANPSVPTRED